MRVSITRDVVKKCPYRDEFDIGSVTITWITESDVPELYDLSAKIDEVSLILLSNEAWTQAVSTLVPHAVVESSWTTGLWGVEIVVPYDAE